MEKMELWWCDNVATSPWQFYLLVIPLVGAWLYGQEQEVKWLRGFGNKKAAWIILGAWMAFQFVVSGMTHLVFACAMPD